MPHTDKEQSKQYFVDYYAKNKEALKAYKREWTKNNRDKVSVYGRKYRYGLDNDQFTKMIEEQGNSCKICSKDLGTCKAVVDHCHSTNSVRGILCNSCNVALGFINDDLGWLNKAKKYLTENP
jgi:hypothetical protein